jgi:hypothetical protein
MIVVQIYNSLLSPCYGGLEDPFPSLLEGLNPNISPTNPPGFGTGHSLFVILNWLFSITPPSQSSTLSSVTDLSFNGLSPSHLRRLRFLGEVPSPASAYATLGAGHGRTCGNATTKKLAKRVVANKEEVSRLRGWRCGGMMRF